MWRASSTVIVVILVGIISSLITLGRGAQELLAPYTLPGVFIITVALEQYMLNSTLSKQSLRVIMGSESSS